jgi:hypothetical protein
LKNDSEGISEEENTWRKMILKVFLGNISGKKLRGVIGEISGQYFWKEFEGDHWGNICRIF